MSEILSEILNTVRFSTRIYTRPTQLSRSVRAERLRRAIRNLIVEYHDSVTSDTGVQPRGRQHTSSPVSRTNTIEYDIIFSIR